MFFHFKCKHPITVRFSRLSSSTLAITAVSAGVWKLLDIGVNNISVATRPRRAKHPVTLFFNTLSDFMCYLVCWPQIWLNLSWVDLSWTLFPPLAVRLLCLLLTVVIVLIVSCHVQLLNYVPAAVMKHDSWPHFWDIPCSSLWDGQNLTNARFFADIFQKLWLNLIIFGIHQWQFTMNSLMKLYSIIMYYIKRINVMLAQ